ncbi:MAG: hypothetical protein WDO73_16515 [Ignavibacteriota bacterium]
MAPHAEQFLQGASRYHPGDRAQPVAFAQTASFLLTTPRIVQFDISNM